MTSQQAYQDSPVCFEGLGVRLCPWTLCGPQLPTLAMEPASSKDLHSSKRQKPPSILFHVPGVHSIRKGEGEGVLWCFWGPEITWMFFQGHLAAGRGCNSWWRTWQLGCDWSTIAGNCSALMSWNVCFYSPVGEDKNKEERSKGQAHTTWDKDFKNYPTLYQKVSLCLKSNWPKSLWIIQYKCMTSNTQEMLQRVATCMHTDVKSLFALLLQYSRLTLKIHNTMRCCLLVCTLCWSLYFLSICMHHLTLGLPPTFVIGAAEMSFFPARGKMHQELK